MDQVINHALAWLLTDSFLKPLGPKGITQKNGKLIPKTAKQSRFSLNPKLYTLNRFSQWQVVSSPPPPQKKKNFKIVRATVATACFHSLGLAAGGLFRDFEVYLEDHGT